MKRESASLLGSVLMALGLVVMVSGVGHSILNQLPQLNPPWFLAHDIVFNIFVDGVLQLAGAGVGGHEQISDRCWWVRRYDKHCRRGNTNRRHN